MITKSQLEAGGPLSFTMDKELLKLVPKVANDPFYSIEANWYRVSYVFKHNTSSKRFVPSFKSFGATKKLRIRNGMNEGDGYSLKKIIISKSDRSHLVIKMNEIPSVANFAFNLMKSGAPDISPLFYERNFSQPTPSYINPQTGKKEWIESLQSSVIVSNELKLGGSYQGFSFNMENNIGYMEKRKVRVFFDSSYAQVGWNIQWVSGNHWSYYGTLTLSSTDISNGYFEYDHYISSVGININNNAGGFTLLSTPSAGKSLRVSKIQVGGIV